MAIVIISVGLAGLLLTFQTVAKSSADPLIHKQLISIAEAQMERTTLKEFAVIVDDATCDFCPTGYTSSVSVASGATWDGVATTDYKIITVTVNYGTGQSFQLVSRRTNNAP